jgi:glyoxylase-like metal-dependent hydrolase (beta-lactamase superfamily II)
MPYVFNSLTSNLWVAQSRLYATNSGVFASQDQACLIDPGIFPDEIETMVEFISHQQLYPQMLVLTHSHWDHILGPEHFPGLKILTHINYVDEVDQRSSAILKTITNWENQAGLSRAKPFELPQPNILFGESTSLQIGNLTLELLHVPGHAPDQLAIYEPTQATLWASDILSDLEIPFISHSLAAYERTLARLAQMDIQVLIPGHGTPTTDAAEIQQRIAEDLAYLAAVRAEVRAALDVGLSLPETVVACASISNRHSEQNAGEHQLNIESVYLELGGDADPNKVGWSREFS